MKKIMIIAHYYHPFSLVGAKRVNYFVKYFKNHGIETVIVKADNRYYGEYVTHEETVETKTVSVEPNKNIFKVSSYLGWYFAYKKAAEEIIKKEHIDAVFITGGPFYYFNLGSYLKKKYNVPYILDFRDPWYRTDINNFNFNGKISNKINSFLEYKAVSKADLIVNVTESLTEEYKNRYSKIAPEKFTTIYNGYDDTINLDLTCKNPEDFKETLNLGIFGKFAYYNISHLDILFKTIKKLQPNLNKNIMIYYLGTEQEILAKAKEYSVRENIKYMGYVSYEEGMKLLAQMDGLIVNNRSKLELGTKIFDYIYLNKPIIAFSQAQSDMSKLARKFTNGFSVTNEKELEEALVKINNLPDKYLDTEKQKSYYSRSIQANILLEYILNM